MKSANTTLSIVIISYNTKQLIQECLDSFYKHLPEDYQVILIDNNSTDNTVNMVKKQYSKVEIITNKKNVGYGVANNQGIAQAKGKYILLLNSDTIASIEAFHQLISFMETHENVGICAPKLLYPDGRIQQNGGGLPNVWNIFSWQFFLDEIPILTHLYRPYQLRDIEFYMSTQPTGWLSGAALLLRKTAIEDIGVFDPKIFMYAEDIDLCIRSHQQNWQVWTVAEAEIIHIGQGSGNRAKAVLGEYQGLRFVCNKHKPQLTAICDQILYYGARLRQLAFKLIGNNQRYEHYQKAAYVVRQPLT